MKKKKFKHNKNQEKKTIYDDTIAKKEPPTKKKRMKKNPEKNIKKIVYPEFSCARCGLPINELSSAIADKETGLPVHFKCVIDFLTKSETLNEKEEIIYIGNGNFAVIFFENPKIRKKFKIIKLIQWEEKGKDYPWKTEIADLASRV